MWADKCSKVTLDNEALRGELFFARKELLGAKAQLEVMAKRLEAATRLRLQQSTPPHGHMPGSAAGTPQGNGVHAPCVASTDAASNGSVGHSPLPAPSEAAEVARLKVRGSSTMLATRGPQMHLHLPAWPHSRMLACDDASR